MAVVWLVGQVAGNEALVAALRRHGLEVSAYAGAPDELLRRTYDARGLVYADATEPSGRALLSSAAARSLPIVARGGEEGATPGLSLDPDLDTEAQAHHLADLLRRPAELRRYPRVPLRRALRVGDVVCHTRNISLYGVRLEGSPPLPPGDFVGEFELGGADGTVVRLVAREVGRAADAVALRCRPERDLDLVLWIHTLLAALEQSPLHGEVDPFGPLFASD